MTHDAIFAAQDAYFAAKHACETSPHPVDSDEHAALMDAMHEAEVALFDLRNDAAERAAENPCDMGPEHFCLNSPEERDDFFDMYDDEDDAAYWDGNGGSDPAYDW